MTTSGSANWTQNRNQIVTRALRIIGLISPGEIPSPEEMTAGAEVLNAMVKAWQSFDVYLWALEWATKTFSASDEVTGTDDNVYTCIRSHTSSTDDTPITGADWSSYWVLRGSTGGVWADATAYAAIGDFTADSDTLDIEQAFLRNGTTDTPLSMLTSEEFFNLANKSSEGKPGSLYLMKGLTKTVYLDRQPDSTDYVLHYLRVRRLEDFDSGSDTPDFPSNWIEALAFGLADRLGIEAGIPPEKQDRIEKRAQMTLAAALANNTESFDYMQICPSFR